MNFRIDKPLGGIRLRMLVPLLILMLTIGIVYGETAVAESLAPPVSSDAVIDGAAKIDPAAQKKAPLSETAPEGVFEDFNKLLRWFVIALLVISVFSGIRILILKKRVGKGTPIQKLPTDSKIPDEKDKPRLMDTGLKKVKRSPFSLTFVFIMIMVAIVFYHTWSSSRPQIIKESYTMFINRISGGEITRVEFTERDILYTDIAKKKYISTMPFDNPVLVDSLLARQITVITKKPSRWAGLLTYMLPFLILIIFWFFFLRGMNSQNSKAFSFGKSKARLHEASKSMITFKDVAGVDEAKEELQEIVEFLKDPKKFQRLGGRIPRGVLLVGRPGTGKTLLAKAVSGEAGVPFFSISGSDFVEMFVGVGAARVRDLFEQAKKSSPCITFIDEIDAVGRHRGTGLGGGHDEREQTLNQLLVEMDGFEPNEAVIIIAATNRPDILDPALLRPGRFDRQVTVDLPDIKGRTEILKVHAAKVPLGEDVHLELIARGTPGFSGADLANIVNEAALIAARKNKQHLEMHDFEEAKDKLILGKEKKSRVIPEEDKRLTAYHEIGHVLTSVFQDKTEPVHKVSIIPRGFTAGATHFLQTDRTGYSRSYLMQIMVELLGGRAAEEIVFGDLTTGAGNDLERVTDIAKKMVCTWGMSDKVGPMTIGKDQGEVYLGKDILAREIHSNETAQMVDSEIRHFVSHAHDKALSILKKYRDLLEVMANELFEKETLGTDDIFAMILKHVGEDETALVNAKYKKAQELKFEHSDRIDIERAKDDIEPAEPDSGEQT
ncbi:MAG: ATP-dependent zinc metalloprotease FtsH [Candidatus Cloacimonadaceae bacterium]|nr:ATP-dependent zinc metalloprotease FtsH [Candidatus Cloacimonadaceae bacterium]